MTTTVLTLIDDTYQATDPAITIIYGLDGNDTIEYAGPLSPNHQHTIDGGAGNDTISSVTGSAVIYGGDDADTLSGGTPGGIGDNIYGGEGDDNINAGSGNPITSFFRNVAYGGSGNDVIAGAGALFGDDGNDRISGRGGLYGGAGDDVLLQKGGLDSKGVIYGGTGNDSLYGGGGNDILVGDTGIDLLVGNGADDYLYMASGGGSAYGGAGNDIGVGSQVNDVFVMEAGNDTALGYAGNDYFYGGDGNDVMYGGEGVDVLLGDAGNDYLEGGEGVNYYFGGAGVDTFVVRDVPSVQVVQDWTSEDLVRLEGSGFSSLADVLANSFQNGAYFVINVNAGTAVWLNGASAANIAADDFVFVA